jgi:ferredoxin
MSKHVNVTDLSRGDAPLVHITAEDQRPLPPPFDDPAKEPPVQPLSDKAKERFEHLLDDTIAVSIPRPKTAEEETVLVNKFLSGLRKVFTKENNWTFLEPTLMTMEHCAKCQTCSDACHIYEESGNNPLYRPSYRSEALRRIYFKYVKNASTWVHGDLDLNWKAVARLIELAHRCNLCRRCAQTCPLGADNALAAREIRKIASMEMGIQPKEVHESGSMLQLRVGSSTGMNSLAVKDNIQFIEEDTTERTGVDTKVPWDVVGADILLMHNAGEILSWPENIGSFALIFNKAGLSWTMSSELAAYDSINYGVWYDDVQFARTAIIHAKAAAKLKVNRIVLGECGPASSTSRARAACRSFAISSNRARRSSTAAVMTSPSPSTIPATWCG